MKEKFENKLVLSPYIYFDEYEPGNPLGSQAGLHKIGAVYYTIAGIPPVYASKLENLFLWGLFNSNDRSQHGNKKVFYKFIDELKYLESNGILVDGNQDLFCSDFSSGR